MKWAFQWLVLHIRVIKVSWEEWCYQVSHQQSDVSAHGSLWAPAEGKNKTLLLEESLVLREVPQCRPGPSEVVTADWGLTEEPEQQL